ncbi:flavin reductase family protein [Nocardia arthritidis]|uniref:flavin reductase family protein n=1 Tax=Nocardia arthritidis TaxID=228602 RepID=UPI0007A49D74|nr:flavin reductase family protein [Nocardia arthritidis]
MNNEVAPLGVPAQQNLLTSFRHVMAAVCTPVSVVTTIAGGRPHGTTVSAFASLSINPPMVLVSLDRHSALLTLIRETGAFGLNVLSSGQSALAVNFARKGETKFVNVAWDLKAGVPRLPGTCGFLACDVAEAVAGGDHVVLLGHVRFVEPTGGQPLTYHSREFGTHAALEEATA